MGVVVTPVDPPPLPRPAQPVEACACGAYNPAPRDLSATCHACGLPIDPERPRPGSEGVAADGEEDRLEPDPDYFLRPGRDPRPGVLALIHAWLIYGGAALVLGLFSVFTAGGLRPIPEMSFGGLLCGLVMLVLLVAATLYATSQVYLVTRNFVLRRRRPARGFAVVARPAEHAARDGAPTSPPPPPPPGSSGS